MKTEISYWACLIISTIWLNGDKPQGEIWAAFWFVGALFFLFFGAIGAKNENS